MRAMPMFWITRRWVILLTEGHPETRLPDGGEILHQRLQLLVIHQVAVAGTDVGIGEILVDLQRARLDPLAVFVVAALLGDLADVDLGVEVGGEGLVVVARVAIHYVEVVYLVEMVLGRVCREDARHSRVETASENRREARILETLLVGPLPAVLEMRLVARLVIGRVEIVDARLQTSLHDGEVLIGQRHVDGDLGAELAHEGHQGVHVVGVDRRGGDIGFADGRGHRIALAFGAAGDHDLGEHIGILRQFVSHDGADTSAADQQYFAHVALLNLLCFCFVILLRRYYLISHPQCPERTECEKIVPTPEWLRFEEPRGPQPLPRGGPQLVPHSFAFPAGRGPPPLF